MVPRGGLYCSSRTPFEVGVPKKKLLNVSQLMCLSVGGGVALWLVRSNLERALRVRALCRGHCVVFLVQDTLLSQCLSPPRCIHKSVPVNLMLGVHLRRLTSQNGSLPKTARFPKHLPYLWPKSALFPILFMTWPLNQNPVSLAAL